jgi:hypothetical protein
MKTLRSAGLILLGLGLVAVVATHQQVGEKEFENEAEANSSRPVRNVPFDKGEVEEEPQGFEERCQAPGVTVCEGFDSPEKFAPAADPGSGIYPAEDGVFRGTMDTTVAASGKGSLKFTIPSYSGPNGAGYWKQAMGMDIGEGRTFYVQFRQRFSPEMLTNTWGGNTYWKQVIFHNGPRTCADVELATTKSNRRDGYPVMYSQCGSDGFQVPLPGGDFLVEQGDYNCHYHNINAKDCFFYPPNTWITFYYKVSIGNWGKANSTIQAWVSLPGQPYKQWTNMTNHKLLNSRPGEDYDTVTLLPYMTAKDPKVYGGPEAYTWYDELIVSTQPIARPK